VKWRHLDHILLALALLLLLLSLLWWPLRMLYADSAFMSWRILQWEHMDAGRWRWLSYITQFFPWLAVKGHAPTAAVLAIYSVALQLPHTIVSYIAWRKAARGTALASLFLSAVWMNSAWFIPVSEMHLAATVVLLWGLFPRHGWLAALAWLTHPGIGPFALLFIVFPGEWARRRNALLWLIPAVAFKQIFGDSYEQGFAAGLLDWQHIPDSYVFAFLKRQWCQPVWLFSIALMPLSWLWLERRRALLHLCFCLGLLLLLALIYRKGDGDIWMQKNLLPLCMAMALPAWLHLDNSVTKTEMPYYDRLLLLTLPFMAYTLWLGQKDALLRWKQLDRRMQQTDGSGKWLVKEDEQLHDALGSVWALPYESLLYSAWKTPKQQKTLLPYQEMPPPEASRPDLFIGAPFMPPLPLSKLNRRYFFLPLRAYQFTNSGKILR